MDRRIRDFLYSRRNIIGSLLAIGGLALHFVGLIGDPLWLPIVIGLYAIGVLLVPAERTLSLRLDASQDSSQIKAGLDRLLGQIRGKVAADIYERVSSIRDSILLTIPADGSGMDAADPSVHLIRQTALDYLPAALESYLALPASYADRQIVDGGSTPHAVLLKQLDLMDRKMREVADDIIRHDSEKLVAHGRFLAERFGTSSLDLGDAAVATAASVPATGAQVAAPTAVPSEATAEARSAAEVEQAERERVR
jgi:hypothetical protein